MTTSIHNAALCAHAQPKPRSLWATVSQIIAIARQRRQLRALDDRMLDDIGISRQQADEEGRQTVWNAPDHWRK